MRQALIRHATADDIPVFAAQMREADRAEVMASHGHEPEEALRNALKLSSHAWCGFMDGEPVCIFGVVPLSILSGEASPWMLATDRISECRAAFLRRNKVYVGFMLALYPLLVNYVHEQNDLSQRWLKWLGFSLDNETTTLANGAIFRRFEMKGG